MKRLFALIPLFIAFSVSAQVDPEIEQEIRQSVKILEQARNAENDSLRLVFANQFEDTFWNLLGNDEKLCSANPHNSGLSST